MVSVTIRRGAESKDLIKPDDVIQLLGITDAGEVQQVRRLVSAVSNTVEDLTDRTFARELITEKFGIDRLDIGEFGNSQTGPYRIMLQRTPVLMVQAVRFDGTEIDVTEFTLEGTETGFLFHREGFSATLLEIQQIERVRTHYTEPLWEVDYSAGYVLPTFPAAETDFVPGNVNTTDNEITANSHKLVDGDTVRFSNEGGVLPAGLDESVDYFVRDFASNTFKVADRPNGPVVTLSDVGSGTHTVLRRDTLPAGLQSDVIQLVVSRFHSRARDLGIKSEKLGDYSVDYGNSSANAAGINEVMQRIQRYRDVV